MKLFISFVFLVIAVAVYIFLNQESLPPLTEVPNDVYDYVIVGAGSAGSVVASRLSENPNVTVLLVEAGSDDRGDYRVTAPALFPTLMNNAWTQHLHTSDTPSPKSRIHMPVRAGMILGGGSSVNIQIYARGSRHDFDQWAKLTGDETWDYDHVLEHFKKSEGILDEDLKASSYFHGNDGPLSISTHKTGWDIYKTIIEACQELGFPYNEDYNGKNMEGISYTQYNRAYGERVSCSRAFIHPALKRPNLHVTVESFVQRILIRNNKAIGIEMVKKNKKYVILASREVILSAGSLQSPKILMLSGIGPKDVLNQHGIPVVRDLPVGRNFQNHPGIEVPISVTSPVTGVLDHSYLLLSFAWYKLFKTGWLATSNSDALLFASVTKEAKEKHWPELQMMFLGKPLGTPVMKALSFDESVLLELGKERDASRYGFICYTSLTRPKSRGYVKVVSNDPYDLPFAKTEFMDNADDLDLLVQGIRICRSLVDTDAMRGVGASVTDTIPLSMCKQYGFDTDDYWKCYIKTQPWFHYHQSGTCKMGSSTDPTAVVDSKLRVKGIEALRVVDASVMPTIVSANTHAATVMIAEKASDMIREEF